jgi:hypothetical protein
MVFYKKQTPEGNLDKYGKPLKFSRDLESDWTIKNNIAHFALKEHASVDVKQGFVLATEITPASHHDSPYLPLCFASSCHTKDPIKNARTLLFLNKMETEYYQIPFIWYHIEPISSLNAIAVLCNSSVWGMYFSTFFSPGEEYK